MMANKDIAELLRGLKENIRVVEAGNADRAMLDQIRSDFLDLIELIKLFLISERDSYYGYFLMNMQFRVDFHSSGIAGIRLNEFPPVFETNPLLLCKFTLKEIMYVVCHEIDHIVLNHPAEMVKSNPDGDEMIFRAFNLAADAAVNDRLDHEIVAEKRKFLSRPEGVITSSVLSDVFHLGPIRAMENYIYYFSLIVDKMDNETPDDGKSRMMRHLRQKGAHSEADAGTENDLYSEDGQKIVTTANYKGDLKDHDWNTELDAEDIIATVKELINAAVGMMSEETRGLMPAHFMSQVQLVNKPPVLSWQAILKKYVGTITANKRKTRARLNRRQPERFDLSGRLDDKILKIVVAIDTSGSVSDNMIEQILREIFAILAKRKHEITVIECDAQIQRVYRARTPADVKTKVIGRGGTMFAPVIEYINQDKYFRDALLIYFTDGYGENSIPKPRTYRNIWVVTDDMRHLSLKEPYGVVLSL